MRLFQFAVHALHPFRAAAADIENEHVLAAPVGIGRHATKKSSPPPPCRREAAPESRGLPARRFRNSRRLRLSRTALVATRAKFLDPQLAALARISRRASSVRAIASGFSLARIDQILGQPGADAFLVQDANARPAGLGHHALDRIAAQDQKRRNA